MACEDPCGKGCENLVHPLWPVPVRVSRVGNIDGNRPFLMTPVQRDRIADDGVDKRFIQGSSRVCSQDEETVGRLNNCLCMKISNLQVTGDDLADSKTLWSAVWTDP